MKGNNDMISAFIWHLRPEIVEFENDDASLKQGTNTNT